MTTRQGPRAVPSDKALEAATQPGSTVDASVTDTLRVAARVLVPTLLTGVIKRRPRVMALARKLQIDRPAVRLHGELRRRYGDRPLRLRVPGRSIDLALSPETVGTVLAGIPSPFSPATGKKAALGKFQPHGVLISEGPERVARRELNEAVLEPGREVHELAEPGARTIAAQAGEMLDAGKLDWETFNICWWRVVRQVTLGGDTAEDRELTDLLASLRQAGNWAYASLDTAIPGSASSSWSAARSRYSVPAASPPHSPLVLALTLFVIGVLGFFFLPENNQAGETPCGSSAPRGCSTSSGISPAFSAWRPR
ncbi:hypothetical protein [Amycolatopsis sp. lyj-84]|uniref:hypothetical protein n=1 Tax=Amycolatopsis sp. lyj-84 TaxID=2789284 RepID=UPI00397E60C7